MKKEEERKTQLLSLERSDKYMHQTIADDFETSVRLVSTVASSSLTQKSGLLPFYQNCN